MPSGRVALAFVVAVAFGGCGDNAVVMREPVRPGLTVADINILHGLFCPPETGMCRLRERVALFFDWLEASGCPDIVTFQEVTGPVLEAVREEAAARCAAVYEEGFLPSGFGLDDMLFLSRHPITDLEISFLLNGFRHVVVARIDHPAGPVDVFTTHLASGSDAGSQPCLNCPPACTAAGAETVRDCQAVQVAEFAEAARRPGAIALLTGDFNAPPGSFVYAHLVARGWIDAWREAGHRECDPATGAGCTSGRVDDDLSQLESPDTNLDERIDYVFVRASDGRECRVDPAADLDGDGIGTGPIAGEPNPFAAACGPRPLPVCWPSDHAGVVADLGCAALARGDTLTSAAATRGPPVPPQSPGRARKMENGPPAPRSEGFPERRPTWSARVGGHRR